MPASESPCTTLPARSSSSLHVMLRPELASERAVLPGSRAAAWLNSSATLDSIGRVSHIEEARPRASSYALGWARDAASAEQQTGTEAAREAGPEGGREGRPEVSPEAGTEAHAQAHEPAAP